MCHHKLDSAAGFPVYSQSGRGGGWQLLGGARTDLSGLAADEVRALFLIAGASASVTPEAKAALRKLVRALPETFRRGQFGEDLSLTEFAGSEPGSSDDRIEAIVGGPSAIVIAQHLAGWGAEIEVVEPPRFEPNSSASPTNCRRSTGARSRRDGHLAVEWSPVAFLNKSTP